MNANANLILIGPMGAGKTTHGKWLARQLEVAPGAPWWMWLWRCIVLPTTPERALLPWLLQPGRWLLAGLVFVLHWGWKGLALLMNGVFWPIRLFLRAMDRLATHVNVEKGMRLADQVLSPLMEIPGLRWVVLAVGLLAGLVVMTTPFNWLGQTLFMLLCWGLSLVLRRLPGRYPSLALAAISLLAMGRYAWWRVTSSIEFESAIESFLGYGLLAAEAYTWLVVVLGFIQTAWPLHRRPADLQGQPASWPTVDVYIPTYNEPLSVVRTTVLASMALDWPKDKVKVFILDDGRREEFREFAESMGVGYIVRPDNNHAKAGNLNHALGKTDGELIAIFDCDHIPTRAFLQMTVGWFQEDARLALLSLYERSRNWHPAIEVARQLESAGQGSFARRMAHHWCEIAQEADARGQPDTAEHALTQARQADPQGARPMVMQGQRLMRQQRPLQALQVWEELMAVQPESFALVAADYAQLAREQGQAERALERLTALYQRAPSVAVLCALNSLQDNATLRRQALMTHISHQPSLSAAQELIRERMFTHVPLDEPEIERLQHALASAAKPLQRYRCAACGFESQHHFWQCPGCHGWDTYPPRRLEEH